MKSPPRARLPTLLRILLHSGFGAKCGAPHFAPSLPNTRLAYAQLPTGDRNAILQKAFDSFEAALRVITEKGRPIDWALYQYNIGIAYATLPTGDREANLQKAYRCLPVSERGRDLRAEA